MIAPCCGLTVASASDAVPVVLFCLFAKFQTPFPCTVCFHIGVRLSLTIRGPSDAIAMLVPHTHTHYTHTHSHTRISHTHTHYTLTHTHTHYTHTHTHYALTHTHALHTVTHTHTHSHAR